MKKNKKFESLDGLKEDLDKIPGAWKLVEEERASWRAAQLVKEARKAADLSQADLAAKINVSQARISKMERGDTPFGPSITLLARIAAACGGALHVSFERRSR